jgi:hypothetical protein
MGEMRLLDATAGVLAPSKTRIRERVPDVGRQFVAAASRKTPLYAGVEGQQAAPGHCQTGEPEPTSSAAARHSQGPQPATLGQGAAL